jgi:hypothetical protein
MLPEARVARVKTAEMASSDVDQSRLADLLRQGARRLRLPHFS